MWQLSILASVVKIFITIGSGAHTTFIHRGRQVINNEGDYQRL